MTIRTHLDAQYVLSAVQDIVAETLIAVSTLISTSEAPVPDSISQLLGTMRNVEAVLSDYAQTSVRPGSAADAHQEAVRVVEHSIPARLRDGGSVSALRLSECGLDELPAEDGRVHVRPDASQCGHTGPA